MSFRIGGTTVINNNADIHWNRLTGVNCVTSSAATRNTTSGSGNVVSGTVYHVERVNNSMRIVKTTQYSNCNCNCQCNCECRD